MIVRLGYVAIPLLTSALVPLATHPEVNWDYRNIFETDFKIIGDFIKRNKMRVDTHPNQFNVINSVDRRVVKNTEHNLWFHANLFEDLDYPLGKMVLHVGSGAGGKEKSLERFKANFKTYPVEITSKIIVENDDKTFTARETLQLCKDLSIPMVLDVHHHLCNNEGEDIKELLGEIFHTWSKESLPPKLHFSSPKNNPADRRHADHIDAKEFIDFIEACRKFDTDIDIMIEAKMKDLALFNLVESIKTIRKDFEWIDNSTFKI